MSPSHELARLSPAEKRELLYGPGGPFGPTGPFSTPEISRYPEVTQQQTKRISFADMVDGKSDQSGFAEDRSDKSQYVSNPVISFGPSNQSGSRSSPTHQSGSRASPVSQSGKRSSPTVSRVDSYHLPNKSGGKAPVKTSSSSSNQEGGDAWMQEKQKRMLNWINRSQVALGARISGKNAN